MSQKPFLLLHLSLLLPLSLSWRNPCSWEGTTSPQKKEKGEENFLYKVCFYCGENNHNIGQCPLKGQTQQGRGSTCEVRSKVPEPPPLSLWLLKFSIDSQRPVSVATFIDSGTDTEFINNQFALSVGIELIPSSKTHKVLVLDGHSLNDSNLETRPNTLLIEGKHKETIKCIVIKSPQLQAVLGSSWLNKHNPRIN